MKQIPKIRKWGEELFTGKNFRALVLVATAISLLVIPYSGAHKSLPSGEYATSIVTDAMPEEPIRSRMSAHTVGTHGTYSTQPETNETDVVLNGEVANYLAFAGFERNYTMRKACGTPFWDDGDLPTNWDLGVHGLNYAGFNKDNNYSRSVGATTDVVTPSNGDQMLQLIYKDEGLEYPTNRIELAQHANGWGNSTQYWYREVYNSAWIYFPLDMDITSLSGDDNNWWEFYTIREHPDDLSPVQGFLLIQPANQSDKIYWEFYSGRVGPNFRYWCEQKKWWVDGEEYRVPKGRWFRLEIYMYRDVSNGTYKVAITDPYRNDAYAQAHPQVKERRLLFDKTDCRTMDFATTNLTQTCFVKLYAAYTYHYPGKPWAIYLDDLYVANYDAIGPRERIHFEQKDYSVAFNGTDFFVSAASNSTVSNFSFDSDKELISFNVTGSEGTVGSTSVVIPRALLEGPYTVLVGGVPPLTLEENGLNATHVAINFTYIHTTHEVLIIPEFPSFLILIPLMITTLLAVLVYRKKYRAHSYSQVDEKPSV